MPTLGVEHCLRGFESSVQKTTRFVREARGWRRLGSNGVYVHIGIGRVELLAGLGLLRIHLAWEEFLESVFVRYMCGARSTSGFAPVLLSPPQPTIAVAMATLLGPSRQFLHWNARSTLARASRFFQAGEPFATAVGAIAQTLDDISAVRNRFAHRSDFSANAFRILVLTAFGYVPRGMSPGRFLLTAHPSLAAGGLRFFEFYSGSLIGASRAIVP